MKKKILFTLLVLASLTSFAHARFFIGIDGGYSMDSMDVETKATVLYSVTKGSDSFTKDAYKGNGYLFDINLGTEHHFDENNYIGFRWFLGLGYGRTNLVNQINKSSYPSHIIEANLGLDLLLDVIKFGNNSSLGIFGGVEGGGSVTLSDAFYYHYNSKTSSLSSGTFVVSPRVGLSLLLSQHHRIEFVAKIPVYAIGSSGSDQNDIEQTLIYRPFQFMLGYKFVF